MQRRRGLTALLLSSALTATTACQVQQTMWSSCDARRGLFGTDGAYVLHCDNGEWNPIMTVHEYGAVLRKEPVAVAPLPARVTVPTPVVDVDHTASGLEVNLTIPSGHTAQIMWNNGQGSMGSIVTDRPTTALGSLTPGTTYRVIARLATADLRVIGSWGAEVAAPYYATTLPVLDIDTSDVAIADKENYIASSVNLSPNGHGFTPYTGTAEIRGRGNFTWQADKKPYRLKLTSKAPLMGMPSNRHWVLLSNPWDYSSLRTLTLTELSKATSLAWTPRFQPVELILNGSYRGIYLLGEHIRIDADRINIDAMDDDDIDGEALTGGYHVELDMRWPSEPDEAGFALPLAGTTYKYVIKDPEAPTAEQGEYIQQYFADFHAAMTAQDATAASVAEYLDVDSYIDWYLVQELTRNHDAWSGSGHMFKPRNGKLTLGPLWDFDQSMGHRLPWTESVPGGNGMPVAAGGWARHLNRPEVLGPQIRERWEDLRPAFVEVVNRLSTIEGSLRTARANDAAVWKRPAWPENTAAYLATFLTAQIEMLDAEL